MGDRAYVVIKNRNEPNTAAIYVHNEGRRIIERVREAVPCMRKGDTWYSTARLIGYLHTQIPGNLSLGVRGITEADRESNYIQLRSAVNAGIVEYCCSTGELKVFHGYLACEHEYPINVGIPPK